VAAMAGGGGGIDLRKPMSGEEFEVVLRKFYSTVLFNSNATRYCTRIIFVMDSETSVGRGPISKNKISPHVIIVVTRSLFSFLTEFT